jgi:malate/lactate dehydrogenase
LLHDLNAALAEGEAMDLSHGSSFYASARVRSLALDEMLGTELEVDPRSVHAQVIGEHGDSEVCVWYRRVSFDLQDVALSLPTIVGSDGAGEVIAPELDDTERAALEHSAEVLQKAIGSVAPEQ